MTNKQSRGRQRQPEPPDRPLAEILPILEEFERRGGAVCLSWVCPACHERIIWPVPNRYVPDEYTHQCKHDGTPCGHRYTGDRFRLFVLMRPPNYQLPPSPN